MSTVQAWPNTVRLVWITGGIVAVNEPGPDVEIDAGLGGRNICKFGVNSYPALFETLRAQGFSIIGATFIVSPEELEGIRPPEFRTATTEGRGWRVWDLRQQWSQIAFAASRHDEMRLLDVASRIASGLEHSETRVADLAAAYSLQLRGHLRGSEAKDYQAFKDLNSSAVYRAIHALFWELAVLRDTLAEFIAVFCLMLTGVTKLSTLLKRLKTSTDPLADEILRISDTTAAGWLARFGSYRDCFTHSAPLEQAADIAFAIQDSRVLAHGLSIPQIYHALPRDVEELVGKRAKGSLFSSFADLAAASMRRRDRTVEPDALEYLHACLNQLADLSAKLIARSPLPPESIRMNAQDIVGEFTSTSENPAS